jgi:ABC-2 type transport system ATP-binding protein
MISSHIINEIEHIADTIGVIANGTMIREMPMSDLREKCPNGLEDYLIELMSGGKTYA